MDRDINAHLANGHRLKMLNPGRELLPDDLQDVNALFIDRENTGLSEQTTHKLISHAAARGLTSVVRTNGLSIQELYFCRNAKPDALVLPQITSATELATAIKVLGDKAPHIIAQIETVEAVDRLNSILLISGISGFLIGPNDLAEAMGHPGQPQHPEVQATVERVAARLRAEARPFGLPMLNAAAEDYWQARGALIQYLPFKAFTELEGIQ
jgi:2-keto-3-deoxy-L-rhamnonate aldolase RhmA